MSLPNFVDSASATVNGTSKEVSYSSRVGNLLLVGIVLNDGSSSVSGIVDSAGTDSTSNPINKWSLISANTFNGTRLELWGCRAAVAITNLTVVLAATQEMTILVAEYTGNTFVSPAQAQVSRGQNPTVAEDITLWTSQPPPNSNCILVGFFSSLSDTITGPSSGSVQNAPAGGVLRASAAESSPLASIAVLDQSTSDVNGDGQLSVGVVTGTTAESSPTDNVSASSLQCIAVILSDGLTFTSVPGFSDISDDVLATPKPALGVNLAKITNNAAFGMVRLETFVGNYKNGDTVPLPISSADGYNYSRDELIYTWGIYTTANPSTGWLTGPDNLWYAAWLVDQTSGLVSTVEWYRRSGSNANPAQSNDGVLTVVTIAQRKKNDLILSTSPVFKNTDTTIYAQDAAMTQGMLQDLSHNAKFSVVNIEAVYMGEFVNGDSVPNPVSPADGYVYDYDEVSFAFSWRWTTVSGAFTQPDMSIGQLGPMKASIDATTGAVSCQVAYIVNSLGGGTAYGRISVVAICERNKNTYKVPVTTYDLVASTPNAWDTAPIFFNVIAGHHLSITAKGTVTVGFPVASYFTVGPAGEISTSWDYGLQSGCLLLGFFDAVGAQIGTPTSPGTSATVTVPSGAVRAFLAVNNSSGTASDKTTFPNSGGQFTVKVLDTDADIALADNFSEIDLNDFMAGEVVPASIMEQIDLNAKEACLSPERFEAATFSNGDTVPLPVSTIDGYKYSRSELTYLWEWADTTNQTGSNLRVPVMFGTVDQTSGLVTLNVYRLPPGSAVVDDGRQFASINVVVLANRQSQLPPTSSISSNPPSDLSSIIADTSDGSTDTINGV